MSAQAYDLLAWYAGRLKAVEMTCTFSRTPSPVTVAAWAAAVGEDFSFVVQVPRSITHVGKLTRPGDLAAFCALLRPLGSRLRALLFATPPSLPADCARLTDMLDALPPGLPGAWEFRHGSWACPRVVEVLCERGSAPVVVDTLDGVSGRQLLPGGGWQPPFVYVRFRRDRYRPADVLGWGETLGQALEEGRAVYAFFRQSPEAAAYALALTEVVTESAGRALQGSR